MKDDAGPLLCMMVTTESPSSDAMQIYLFHHNPSYKQATYLLTELSGFWLLILQTCLECKWNVYADQASIYANTWCAWNFGRKQCYSIMAGSPLLPELKISHLFSAMLFNTLFGNPYKFYTKNAVQAPSKQITWLEYEVSGCCHRGCCGPTLHSAANAVIDTWSKICG